MKTIEEIIRILKEHKEELRDRFKVKEIGVFGSYVRGEQKRKGSDIDILVEFEEPIGFLEFLGLEEYLSDLLGAKVDLVSRKALKPRIGGYILKEVVYI
jgi:predicted nucleotidyltransferase